MQSDEAISRIFELLTNFQKVAGILINSDKTQALGLNSKFDDFYKARIKMFTNIMILRVQMFADLRQMTKLEQNKLLIELTRDCQIHKGYMSSILDRVRFLNG